jgi:ABC-2 type transport system ATP-binding protein
VLTASGASVVNGENGSLLVTKAVSSQIGELAHSAGIALHELSPQQASLEDVFMDLTSDSIDYHGITNTAASK